MSTPVPLRSDFDASRLHKLARGSRDPNQTRRLLALAEVYAGGSRSDAPITGATMRRKSSLQGLYSHQRVRACADLIPKKTQNQSQLILISV
jgi:hypothetical protein